MRILPLDCWVASSKESSSGWYTSVLCPWALPEKHWSHTSRDSRWSQKHPQFSLPTTRPITMRQRSQLPLAFYQLALSTVPGKKRTHSPSERQLPGGGRCGQLPSSSAQPRANGALGTTHSNNHSPIIPAHTHPETRSLAHGHAGRKNSHAQNQHPHRELHTQRRGIAQELRDTQTFGQHSSRVEIHSRSTQTNTPTGSQGESYVNRYHPHIHPKLGRRDSQAVT